MKSIRYLAVFCPTMAALGCGASPDTSESTAETQSAIIDGSVGLIATGTLSGALSDHSRETADPLENGVAGNLLGGIGSGLAYAGGNTFLALPDRGPNALSYNGDVDDTVSYVNRFQTVDLKLKKARSASALPFELSPKLLDTTLLYSKEPLVYGTGTDAGLPDGASALNRKRRFYFTGRSDNFDPTELSTNQHDARFDPESVRVSNDGNRVYISDEYGPYIYEFDRETGRRLRSFTLPSDFAVSTLSAQGSVEIADNTEGRVANKGMEGLALTPDGNTLVGAMQSPLLQDGGTNGRFTRIVVLSLESGATFQYAYELTNIGTDKKPKYPTISDILAIDDHEFLVDERDGKGLGDDSTAVFKRIYQIDLSGATEVSGVTGDVNLAGLAVGKSLFLDVVAALNAQGIDSNNIPSKLEGLAFGPDVMLGSAKQHTLFVANDNDFTGTVVDTTHPDGIDNPNVFFVFGVPADTLPDYIPQQFTDGCYD